MMAQLPCEPTKPHCVASGRRRPSFVRRNMNRDVEEVKIGESFSAPAKVKGTAVNQASESLFSYQIQRLHALAADQGSAISSPPIRQAKKKLRPSSPFCTSRAATPLTSRAATPLIGVQQGTADAIALCRGDLPGRSIWDHFSTGSTFDRSSTGSSLDRSSTGSSLDSERPSSARSRSTPYKSACVASGRSRPSSVRRLRHPVRGTVPLVDVADDDELSVDSLPSSPLHANTPDCYITVSPTSPAQSKADREVYLPPIVHKKIIVDSGKLTPPGLYGDTPRNGSRRPSVDSTVSTAVSESDNNF